MPIRLNLLAEQQAAEEARRRDPVKRAIWVGGALITLFLIWSASAQFRLRGARADLAAQETRWKQIEPQFRLVTTNQWESGQLRKKLESLEKYVTNRFLWANTLNALQYAADEPVRVVTVTGTSASTEQKHELVSQSINVPVPQRSWWQWSAEPLKTNVVDAAKALLGMITNTNKPNLVRYQSELISTLTITTNPVQILARIEVVKPETVTEKVTFIVHARDYSSSPPLQRMDAFYAALTNTPFFRPFIGKTNILLQPGPVQPRPDPADHINSTALYIPFTVQFFFPERIRSNE